MFIHPTDESYERFIARGIAGPFVMLNLLKYRVRADYSGASDLAPEEAASGEEAYQLYITAVLPVVAAAGAEMIFMAEGGQHLIGPTDETWDGVLLVRYPSMEAFMGMVGSPGYQAISGHRTAALADSRLLPMIESG